MAGKQADIKVGVITSYTDKGMFQAKKALDDFKGKILEADGVGGKLKAGWTQATDTIKNNAAGLAVAGGAALVAFGVKAVGAFTDTSKAALDLSTATGLSTEQASRWIAVGDDFEVSATALQTGLGKIAKTMDDTKWSQYGIATRDAGGEARSTNDILLDSFDMLSKVTNETERARIGQQLFGKGYQSLTPILGKTRGEYEKMLSTVEKGQVITAEEAEKAEKFRLAQDQLGDALQDVTLAVGEQVAALAPLLVKIAEAISLITQGTDTDFTDKMGDDLAALREQYGLTAEQQVQFMEDLYSGIKTFEEVKAEIVAMSDSLRTQEKSWETQTGWLDKVAEASSETDRETRRLTGSFEAIKPPIDTAARSMSAFRENTAEADLAFQALTGKLDEEEAWENVNTKIAEYAANTEISGQDTRDLTRDIAAYVIETDTIPAEKKTDIIALLDQGKLEEAKMVLADVTKDRDIYLRLIATGSGDIIAKLGAIGASATGGPESGLTLVGEKGPEIVDLPSGSFVHTAAKTQGMLNGGGGGNTVNLTVNAGLGTNGYEVSKAIVNGLAEYDRRNGTHIVTPAGR